MVLSGLWGGSHRRGRGGDFRRVCPETQIHVGLIGMLGGFQGAIFLQKRGRRAALRQNHPEPITSHFQRSCVLCDVGKAGGGTVGPAPSLQTRLC